jgi:hypothetical protein
LLVALVLPSTAHADDPFDLFGLPDPEEPADPPASCDGDAPPWPCLVRSDGEPDAAPAEIRESIDRRDLWDLGAGDVGHPTAAARALGAWLEADGGVALAGATSLEHRWTVEGFPIDSLANGGAETRIPLAFLETIEVITGGAPASARASTGAIVDVRLRGPVEDGVAARIWTAASAPDRPVRPTPGTYDPLSLELDDPMAIGMVVTGGGPARVGAVDREWIFLGGTMTMSGDGATRIARRLTDADQDGLYDRDADGVVGTEVVDRQRRGFAVAPNMTMLLRLGAGEGAHDLAATVLATVQIARRMSGEGTEAATTAVRSSFAGDAFLTWTSRWPRTELTVTAGWHRATRRESPAEPGAGDRVQIATAYVPPLADIPEDEAFVTACTDSVDPAVDPYPFVQNCAIPTGFYLYGGVGQLVDLVGDRPVVTAEVARRFRAAGRHRAAAGVTGEDARWVVDRRWSGGALERRLTETAILTSRFVDTAGPGLDDDCGDVGPCRWLDVATETYRTRYLAAWLEDAWRPARGLTLQAGLRWESMQVGDAIRFTDQLAPRVGVGLDPTGRGLGRVFAAWSRLHPALPAGLGTIVADEPEVYTRLDSPIGTTHVLAPNGGLPVAADLAAPVVDELVAGVEWVIADRLQLGALIRQRSLRHGMETVAGTLDNPGDVAGGALPVRRDSRDLQVWFGNALDAWVHVRVGWVRSQQRGSWPGPVDPTEGVTLYDSSFEGATGNDHGRLPLDLPHRLIAETVFAGRRAGFDLTCGLRFEVASGRPVGALAGPDGEVRLLPRGSVGRTPTTSTAILHVAARRGRFELAVDLVDVFDRRAPAAVDERWTTAEDVLPIEGGSEADLVWARDLDGRRVAPNPGYGTATRYRAPLAGRVSLSATF